MALSADPSVTYNTRGNILNAATITNGTPNTGNIVDYSWSASAGRAGLRSTVLRHGLPATNGIQVQAFSAGDSTPHYDTVPVNNFIIAQTTSTVAQQSFFLPTGKYSLTITNLDASHTVAVSITSNPEA